jgi:hypothetical protein
MTDYKQRQSGVSTFKERENVQIEQERIYFFIKNVKNNIQNVLFSFKKECRGEPELYNLKP